ncbi:MAG: hypothetical protein KKE17_10385 [Proteobacteria bacterium]|nr:hypothetical protein [Pseudomonadota bacterium]
MQKQNIPATLAPRLLCRDIADTFIADISSAEKFDLRFIDLLCEMATAENQDVAEAANTAIYGRIIEGLCDDFSDRGIKICNEVLARILFFVASLKAYSQLNALLEKLDLNSREKIIARYNRIRRNESILGASAKSPKRIFILSRVTIGADIAITSIILKRLIQTFPQAEKILVGPDHLREIFSGFPNVSFAEPEYKRYGSLAERTFAWFEVYKKINDLHPLADTGDTLLFDPDSRLSQLGLLPLVKEENTFLFPSRATPREGENPSLAALTNLWLDKVIGDQAHCFPSVSFQEKHITHTTTFFKQFSPELLKITINFGVGRNEGKRISDSFEEQLIFSLLQRNNTIIILDSGSSPLSKERVSNFLARAAKQSIPQIFMTESELAEKIIPFTHGIIGFRGSVGAIGALISGSDGFFGYDSCCQHLAAALGIPAVTTFAGIPNERFMARWHPEGEHAATTVIPVLKPETLTPEQISALAVKTAITFHETINKYRLEAKG